MEQIKLNKEIPEIEFKLNSEDSYLLIHNVVVNSENNTKKGWKNFISTVKLSTELSYLVFDDAQQRFIDERKNQFPISLLVDPYQLQPIFQLNKLIRNETFTIGINPDIMFYRTLKIEIKNSESIDSDHTLVFNIEKFKLD
ncbi:MAG: hypothetical protein RLZZ46_892 [Bacteroidota bacterium]